MDHNFARSPNFINGIVDDHTVSYNSRRFPRLLNQNKFTVASAAEPYAPSTAAGYSLSPPSIGSTPVRDSSSDDKEFSVTVLKYMSQILMEEDIEDKPSMFYDPLGLHATERAFYDALGQQYPAFPNQGQPPPHVNRNVESPDDAFSGGSNGDYGTTSSSSTSTSSDPQWPSFSQSDPTGDSLFWRNSQLNGGSNFLANPSNSVTNIRDGLKFLGQNSFTDKLSVLQFRRGLEEASKFLPRGNQLVRNLNSSMVSPGWKEEDQVAEKSERGNSTDGSRGRKNLKRDDVVLEEGRTNKQSAVYVEESDLVMFDDALSAVCVNYRRLQISEAGNALQTNGQPQGAYGGTGKSIRATKQGKKKDTVDLNSLLMLLRYKLSQRVTLKQQMSY
ncbi:Scarecrow-like protein 14 [Morella rubra]|uniref:Scarecrow-like protein 14 n=1 Tax=Morella rubra TaxID=262757 RepID=A0A6A1V2B3_9ROSI|nr:Scarecrow-like protein 14 [Morella rubra]